MDKTSIDHPYPEMTIIRKVDSRGQYSYVIRYKGQLRRLVKNIRSMEDCVILSNTAARMILNEGNTHL